MDKRMFTIPQAAEYSARSRSVLYEAHKKGKLAFVKFGKSTRVEKVELDRYLDAEGRTVSTRAA